MKKNPKKAPYTISKGTNEEIIKEILKLPDNEQGLNLRRTHLTSLTGVKLPSGLKTLNLSHTQLVNLNGVEFPSGLQRISLSGSALNSLKDANFPERLDYLRLESLRELDLADAQFHENLSQLYLSNSTLKNYEDKLYLPNLTHLWLDGTNLTVLPEYIRDLKKLTSLNLSNLKLKELPYWLTELNLPFFRKNFNGGICLDGTTVEGVDMSIFDKPQEEIRQWFEDRTKKEPLNELKVIFLGYGEAGKTLTITRLLNNCKKIPNFRESSTPGIVIQDKSYRIGDREVKIHFWDFGGQEILHSMHRMFLTKRTLYVVMLNVRDGNQDEHARYWLHNLKSFADGAPVLLVLNKMDMNANASINETDLKQLYPNLKATVKLSALRDSKTAFNNKFLQVLKDQIRDMEILNLPLTAAGQKVKEKIQNMEYDYIYGDTFRRYCNNSGVLDSDTTRQSLLDTFRQLGICFSYSGSSELEQHVVLKPAWITNALYIILFNEIHTVTNGLVPHRAIYEILNSQDTKKIRRTVANATYNPKEVKYVLEVFRKFRLSFQVNDSTEFLPMLCDANTPPKTMEYENDPNALEFRMHYAYLPDNVIHRLMVERYKELDHSNVWLTGARFTSIDTGRSAVVKSEGNMIRILVRAEKEPRDPQRYLDDLKEHLERINMEMGLTVSKQEVIYKDNGITESFDYNWLLMNQEHGVQKILSMSQNKWILLADVLMQSDFPEDEKQKKLREDIRQACEWLQNRKKYWDSSEDERTDYLMDMLMAKDYIVLDQHRGGFSESGIQSGELDLDIRRTPGDAWSALEALNLKGSDAKWLKYWDRHLKKLLDNYNEVGRTFLFHVSYVQCPKDNFTKICNDLYDHLRLYSPDGFELMQRFVQEVPLTDDPLHQSGFMRTVKCIYNCGGLQMTVYHFFVRIGE